MGTSFVNFLGKGYWTHDIFLEGFSYLLAREFNKIKDKQEWQIDLINKWMTAATAGCVGCVTSYFKHFDTHDKVQLLRATLIEMLSQLKQNPEYVTVSELNENDISQGRWDNVNANSFINIVQLTLKLIDGQLATDASSPIDYWDID